MPARPNDLRPLTEGAPLSSVIERENLDDKIYAKLRSLVENRRLLPGHQLRPRHGAVADEVEPLAGHVGQEPDRDATGNVQLVAEGPRDVHPLDIGEGQPDVPVVEVGILESRDEDDVTVSLGAIASASVSDSAAAQIRDFVGSCLEHDEYSRQCPDHAYPIHSLYLDSEDLRLYWDVINGVKNRSKLRLRFYDDDPESPVFFEIKRRINDAIVKQRCPVRREAVRSLLSGQLPTPEDLCSTRPECFFLFFVVE